MTEAQLRAFVAVADYGGFREAAARLHLSQPGISRAVRALEDELGEELLVRAHGAVSLTPSGERALRRSRAMLAEAEAMRQEVDEHRGIASGRVRLGSMPSVSATILPGLLALVEHRHPALELTVLEGHDDELVAWARDGTVDLAVVAGKHPGLTAQPLARDELVAVLPARHPLATRGAIDPRAIADAPFILTRAGCERLVLDTLRAADVTPNVQHEVTEASAILAMVGEDLGVSIMPRLAARDPTPGVALRPLRPRAERRLYLARPADRAPSPACTVLLDEAERWVRSSSA